jgi:hypothetical protein
MATVTLMVGCGRLTNGHLRVGRPGGQRKKLIFFFVGRAIDLGKRISQAQSADHLEQYANIFQVIIVNGTAFELLEVLRITRARLVVA